MNILVVNHYAGSPRYGMEFRVYYLAREWVRSGHRVRICSGSYSHIRRLQPSLNGRTCATEIVDQIEYMWFRTPFYRGNGLMRVLSMVSFIYSLWCNSRSLADSFRPDVVIASSTYPMDIWPAERIAKFSHAKLVYEVHDLWPLSPIELGGMPRWHPFILWVQMAEDYAYKVSNRVVSMLPKTLEYMVSRGLDPAKWVYVPNGVDLNEWHESPPLPDDLNTALGDVRARGEPVLGYVGTHGLANSLDVLLDAASLLQGRLQIILVGSGPERDRLFKRVQEEGLANVTMFNPVHKSLIPALLKSFDLAYIGLLPQPLFRFGISPNKLFDYMMSGKPIIQAISSGNDLVDDIGCGLSVSPGNPVAIAEAAFELCSLNSHQLSLMGEKGRRYVQSTHSYNLLALKFLSVLN